MDNKYVALLRGINVGGKNLIKMVDLKSCFEDMGYKNVVTYIQSGNVIFSTDDTDKISITSKIEQTLSEKFKYTSLVVLVGYEHLKAVVNKAPKDFGTNPDEYRYDVLFLKEPFTTEEALESIRTREGVDRVWDGEGVLYFSRLISKAGSSYLNELVGSAVYKKMTIRNWNTTTKLWALMG